VKGIKGEISCGKMKQTMHSHIMPYKQQMK